MDETRHDSLTNGCPSVVTVGPCNEWMETMCTSAGRYFSNASFSGALTEVCPATIEFILVADENGTGQTRRLASAVCQSTICCLVVIEKLTYMDRIL